MTTNRYDVAIVGASIAGCAAAMLFSKKGARIALIERERAMDAYKKVCTHFIQPSATPTIQRLGLAGPIEEAGGIRNDMQFWTRWGWVRKSPREPRYGYNIRRQTLDPIIRERASNAPGVDFIPGESVHELIFEAGRPVGVRTEGRGGADGGGRTHRCRRRPALAGRRPCRHPPQDDEERPVRVFCLLPQPFAGRPCVLADVVSRARHGLHLSE